jgi:V-type H+-transporting ATPase subunit a
MLFRITRGKALTHFSAPFTQDKTQKVVYMVVYQDGQMIRDRVQKICDSFMGSRFEIGSLGDNLFSELSDVRSKIEGDRELLKTSKTTLREYLISINGNCDDKLPSTLETYQNFVAKEKSIYNVMNMMKLRQNTYIGFIWAPVEIEPTIKHELAEYQTTEFQSWRSDYEAEHAIQPPSYFKTNDVTATLQLITNTYGVPSYQEANPSCFSVVTFPFLFAVMFGDYGHGSLILFVGTCMVLFNDYL